MVVLRDAACVVLIDFAHIVRPDVQPVPQVGFYMKSVLGIGVGQHPVTLVPGDVVFIREEGTNAPQLEDTLVAVHDRELVAAHELMAGLLIVETH